MPPSANAANPISNAVQSSSAQSASSQVGVSSAGSSSGSGSKSVVKQIVLDDDEFVKITGISFIVLLILLTIMFYYRDDIREMKSKM